MDSVVLERELDVDPIEEMRLRTWARQNYAPADERDDAWHPDRAGRNAAEGSRAQQLIRLWTVAGRRCGAEHRIPC